MCQSWYNAYVRQSYMAGKVLSKDSSCMVGERYNDSCAYLCIPCWEIIFWSSSFTTLVLIEHFHCVIATKHSMSIKRIENNMRT
jgi:hypothetical protein